MQEVARDAGLTHAPVAVDDQRVALARFGSSGRDLIEDVPAAGHPLGGHGAPTM